EARVLDGRLARREVGSSAVTKWLFFAAIGAIAASGCGTPADAGVAVTAQNLTLTKSATPFGAGLTGGVDVVFQVGYYTGTALTIDAISLQLFSGTSTTQVLSRAAFTVASGAPTLPATLAAGASTTIHYWIAIDQLTPAETTTLCAGPISAGGAATVSGRAPSTISAQPVNATGCP
ncbi:MAG: hypothetical protein ACHREM_28175, partial [Polyangiales bacterium]